MQMAQNQKSRNSEGICKKIRAAVSLRSIRQTSHHPAKPQGSISATPHPNLEVQVTKIPANAHGHVEKDAPKEAKPSVHFTAAKSKSFKDDVPLHQKGDGGQEVETNDGFSDYIRKIKHKMGIAPNVSAGRSATRRFGARRSATRRDSFDDRVSNYINRAKIKIRRTSSAGDDEGVSSKRGMHQELAVQDIVLK